MKINKKDGQRGAAAVEFALVIPLLLLFIFGIIEFSIILYDKAVVTNASREAARKWVVHRDDELVVKLDFGQVSKAVTDYSKDRLISFGGKGLTTELFVDTESPPVAFVLADTTDPIPYARGDSLKVGVNYEYEFLLLPGLVQNLLPTLNLKAETIMRAE